MDDDEDDADSHGKECSIYSRTKRAASRRTREDFDLSTTYPLANSHGNAYLESSSHARYSELYSELAVRNYLETNRDDVANYSVANSHGDHSISSENRERSFRENAETDQLTWDTRQHTNYEVANSHSNYRVFYDSQTQQRDLLQTTVWPIESWREQLFGNTCVTEEKLQKSENVESVGDETRTKSEAKSDPIEPTCDIEQCLVQIEESLLNIEQNLLHVQDLDIPELRNLLYKSPSIEKSLYEVQDLLYADGIVPVITKRKSSTLESEDEDDEDEDEEEEEEEEEVWTDRNITVKDNDNEDDDAGAGAFDASNEESSDTANAEENNQSGSMDDRSNTDCVNGSTVFRETTTDSNYTEKPMNFIPNSLNKTLPRRIVLDGAKENIRLCSSEPEEPMIIDYNLNTSCADKKPFWRDKCHSRTNSLDENSKFSNLDSSDKRETGKSSLQNLLFESTNNNFLDFTGKARSEEMLQNRSKTNKKGTRQKQWTIMEAKTEDFRRKLESISSNRCFAVSAANEQKRTKLSKEVTTNVTRPREKSRGTGSTDKLQDKDKESGGKSFDKRKRKKISSRSQSSSENALVPSKLISLSLSLLLAALLQAVSYDRSGLLQ
ncbi:uncharacterized protein LOC143265124 [Megachile rotundata]|uniref:uncharacterized protein LOC143265124 n=1 Tax=Megachile rotundata TaxID=143995 RepID=UPI003FD10536